MRWVVAVLAVCVCVIVGACGGDDSTSPKTSVSDPGPNSTLDDPGPNDTSGGPQTVQGKVTFDASGCVSLAQDAGPLSLHFTGYSLENGALIAEDDKRVLAHSGDQLVVTGRPSSDPADACGAAFGVESLNSVLPAG